MSMNPPSHPYLAGALPAQPTGYQQIPQYQQQYQQEQQGQQGAGQALAPQPVQQQFSHHPLTQLPGVPAPLQFQLYPTFVPQGQLLQSPPTAVYALPHPYQYPGFQQQSQQAQSQAQSMSPLPPQSPLAGTLSLRQYTPTPVIPVQQGQAQAKTPSTGGSSVLSPGSSFSSSIGQLSKKTSSNIKNPIEKPKFSNVASSATPPSIPGGSAATLLGSHEPLVHSYDVANLRSGSIISYDSNGHVTKPRVTTTMWEDEKTLCYQVEANGVSVVRRADNDMINGTKLLNVAKITRGRRDGILKAERIRHVVKIGSMHLKGVWIPFERAQAMAEREKIADYLYPLFVKDIQSVLRETSNSDEEKFSRMNSPPPSEPVSLSQPFQMPLHPQNYNYDSWYSTRSATTILPQPSQLGLTRTNSPFAYQFTPAHASYRPHSNPPSFDYNTGHSPPNASASASANANANASANATVNTNSRPLFNQSIAPPLASVISTPSSGENATTTTTATAANTTAGSARFVSAPQPQQPHQLSSKLLRQPSTASDGTDRSTSDSDASKND